MDRRSRGDVYTAEQVKRVLNGSGVDIYNEVDSDFIVFCPFHNNWRTPAGEVSKENGLFFCFSCQTTKSLTEFVMYTSKKTFFEATRYIGGQEKKLSIENIIEKALSHVPDYKEFDSSVIDRLHDQLRSSDRARNYLLGRKVSQESMIKFKLGFSDKHDMVTIPIHSHTGIAVGFVGRSIEGKDFKNTLGLPKSKVLFNLFRVKSFDRVYVVESSFDAIRLDQLGFPAVATLGAMLSKTQTDLLKKFFNNIIVIADNDEAGSGMQNTLVERLGSRVSTIILDKQYKDIGDMDDETIRTLEFQFDKSIMAMLN